MKVIGDPRRGYQLKQRSQLRLLRGVLNRNGHWVCSYASFGWDKLFLGFGVEVLLGGLVKVVLPSWMLCLIVWRMRGCWQRRINERLMIYHHVVGKVYSGGEIKYVSEAFSASAAMRRLRTAGELVQFCELWIGCGRVATTHGRGN